VNKTNWTAREKVLDYEAMTLRADLENERAMRAGEHDDTHSRIEKLHAELVEARAELAKRDAEHHAAIMRMANIAAAESMENDALRAAIEAHNARCSDLEVCGAQTRPEHMVIPLPPAQQEGK
jgi:hypothetical protein